MSAKKILVLTDAPDRPETALLKGLEDLGHQLTIIAGSSQALTRYPDLQLQKAGQRIIHRISSRISISTIRLIRQLAPGHDIMHCFTARGLSNAVIGTPFNSQIKIIAYRGTTGHLSRFDPSSWLSFLNPRIAGISCVSNAVKDYLISQGVSPKKLLTIYKGHQPSWYENVAAIDLADFGIPHGTPTICFVGNMRAVKGADILVDAFSTLAHSSAHLILVGEVRDSAVMRAIERSPAAHRIHLTGSRKDALSIVKASDIFVMPSRAREGLPKAVIEAMLLGKPVVVTDAGGMPEMISHGESGLMAKANDCGSLSSCLATLLEQPAQQIAIGAQGKLRAIKQFSVAKMIDETLALYERVLKN